MRDSTGSDVTFDVETARALLKNAIEVRGFAYAPYSGFPVGAALLAADGRVFTGANVENASYSLSTCAERAALVKAVSEGSRSFRAIAVVGPRDDEPCPPCGSCRQVLHEMAPDLLVVTAGGDGEPQITALRQLLPDPFNGPRE